MPKLKFEGPLISFFGNSVTIEEGFLLDLLKKIDRSKVILDSSDKIRPGIIVLLNGKDIRLLGNKIFNERKLSMEDEVTFIPINHGG